MPAAARMSGPRAIASGLVGLVLLAAGGSGAFGQQYAFLPVPGSPKGVTSLFEDSRGRLWLGGSQPACFDGTRFYDLHAYGFPVADAYDFSEDTGGGIWIGAETGVYRFARGRTEKVGKGVAVSVIAVAPDFAVAAMGPLAGGYPSRVSLFRIRRTAAGWISEPVTRLDSPGPLTLDPNGAILYPWPGKGWKEIRVRDLARWRPGEDLPVTRHIIPSGFPENGSLKVVRDHSGCVWLGAVGGNIYDCGKGVQSAFPPDMSPRPTMREAPDGDMVLSGYSLLAIGRPGSFRIATRANGLPGIVEAIEGRDGTAWLATYQGLYRSASLFRAEYWTIRDGVAGPPWSIARSGGRVYAGLDNRIVALARDRSRWETVTRFQNRGSVSGLLAAEGGTLLATLDGGGAIQLSADGAIVARTEKDRPRGGDMRLTRTPDGQVWMAGSGLGRLTRAGSILKWDGHPLQTQPSANVLAVKYEAHTRKLWACYDGGLVSRDQQGKWREFTTRDGLLANPCWDLAALPDGDVWYAYHALHAITLIRPLASGGITVRHYDARDGLTESGADAFVADSRGRLWRGGSLGVYVADATEAEAGEWLQLNLSDGFSANGMNTGSVYVDADGSLWWGADNDLAHYTPPPDLVTPRFSPQVFVSAFSWEGAPPRLAEAVGSSPHGSKLVAHIGSLQFDRRNALRVRYRVLPEESTWRESSSLDLPLGSLPSGGHTLEVQGRVFTGPWSKTASRSFNVLRPTWLGWPFLAAYALTLASLPVGAYLSRRRRRAEEATLLPDLAGLRAAVLLPDAHELSGMLLDSRFEVGLKLSGGGFADVMRGRDRSQERACAIKVFRGEFKDKAWMQRRFEQEVAALRRVRHPNVVSIYAQGRTPYGAPYLVMEFIDGSSLREVLKRGPLSPRRTARLLRQLADALDAIHAQRIWHRDVKPENVIIRNEGTPREQAVLIDFSIAIVKDADEALHGLSRAAGTFAYMAPEQVMGYADATSDIHSFAKLAIEMLAGRSLSLLLPDATLDLPVRVRALLNGMGLKLSDVTITMFAGALEFDPAKRPRGAGSFIAPLVGDLERNAPAEGG